MTWESSILFMGKPPPWSLTPPWPHRLPCFCITSASTSPQHPQGSRLGLPHAEDLNILVQHSTTSPYTINVGHIESLRDFADIKSGGNIKSRWSEVVVIILCQWFLNLLPTKLGLPVWQHWLGLAGDLRKLSHQDKLCSNLSGISSNLIRRQKRSHAFTACLACGSLNEGYMKN